jgi:hypothetical protein
MDDDNDDAAAAAVDLTSPPHDTTTTTTATMESRMLTPEPGHRERLPNLFEVLSRRTLAPV